MRRIDFLDFFDVRKNDEKVDPTQMGYEQGRRKRAKKSKSPACFGQIVVKIGKIGKITIF